MMNFHLVLIKVGSILPNSDRIRGEYTITLPAGTVIRIREGDIKDICIRVIKRKPVKNH